MDIRVILLILFAFLGLVPVGCWMPRNHFTSPCSGCYEGGEYGGMAHLYSWDDKAKCRVGAGCHECGYTGKRRTYFNPKEIEKDMRELEAAFTAQQLEKVTK